ncbi:Protein of unknown function [Bacillus toyonensis]|nr:Protein of unknown function [Bacillus toyonensis]
MLKDHFYDRWLYLEYQLYLHFANHNRNGISSKFSCERSTYY